MNVKKTGLKNYQMKQKILEILEEIGFMDIFLDYVRFRNLRKELILIKNNPSRFFKTHPESEILLEINPKFSLDIGAHYGEYGYFLNRIKKSEVLAFEPVKRTRNIQLKAIRSMGTSVICLPFGVGEKKSILNITHSKRDSMNHISKNKGEKIKIINLDSIDLKKVDFIKMDIEGFELRALKGAVKLLERDKPVLLCEVKDEFLKRYGDSKIKLITFLSSIGYSVVKEYENDLVFRHK
jgi:FkbM family methyltransferase